MKTTDILKESVLCVGDIEDKEKNRDFYEKSYKLMDFLLNDTPEKERILEELTAEYKELVNQPVCPLEREQNYPTLEEVKQALWELNELPENEKIDSIKDELTDFIKDFWETVLTA